MSGNKSKHARKYEKPLRNDNVKETKLEPDKKLGEDIHENEEELGIADEEEHEEESYLGMDNFMERDDSPEKEEDE